MSTTIEDQREKAGFHFDEAIYPDVLVSIELKNILTSSCSEYQEIQVIDTSFGRTLVTDGKTQSTEMDERSYHESLVHPPMLKCAVSKGNNDGPRSVFIGGGGELATAREVLRHASVERVVMVDLDEKVIEVCSKYLPEWGGEKVRNDPRFELVIGDAYEYLNDCIEKFDVIIMDISDPIEAGPGIMLYTEEFYNHAKTLLNPNGVFVTQAGIADGIQPESGKDCASFAAIANTLNASFDCMVPYTINIPSFGSDWGYVMAYDSCEEAQVDIGRYVDISSSELELMIKNMITETSHLFSETESKDKFHSLMYYDGLTHRRMFSLPKPLRDNMALDKRIMTKDNPVFMF